MHDDRLGTRGLEECRVHPVAGKGVAPFLRLGFLPHRGPGVRVDDRRAADGRRRVVEELEPAATDSGQLSGPLDDRGVRAVADWVGQPDLHAERAAEQRQRVVDVVAVTDERQDEPVKSTVTLAQGEDVGERLARMLAEGQGVDDRDRGLGGKLGDHGVRPRPGDDGIDEPFEVASNVANALAGAHHDVFGQVDRVTAELVHPGLEGHPGAKAGALEQHRDRPPGEGRPGVPALSQVLRFELRRKVIQAPDLGDRQVGHRQEVAPTKGRRWLSRGIHGATVAAQMARRAEGADEDVSERT